MNFDDERTLAEVMAWLRDEPVAVDAAGPTERVPPSEPSVSRPSKPSPRSVRWFADSAVGWAGLLLAQLKTPPGIFSPAVIRHAEVLLGALEDVRAEIGRMHRPKVNCPRCGEPMPITCFDEQRELWLALCAGCRLAADVTFLGRIAGTTAGGLGREG
jgi:hypothetical protein